ncbi:MAG: hypothetical protein E6J29_03935 [Chloroflexi bacterium]|nr:MAG: hypothetical protein E6J29_03935 [Chloroflexota bacterium]
MEQRIKNPPPWWAALKSSALAPNCVYPAAEPIAAEQSTLPAASPGKAAADGPTLGRGARVGGGGRGGM